MNKHIQVHLLIERKDGIGEPIFQGAFFKKENAENKKKSLTGKFITHMIVDISDSISSAAWNTVKDEFTKER